DRHRDDGVVTGLYLVGAQFEIVILEARVAQSETKRIKRLPLEVAVCAVLHAVVFEGRKLRNGFIKRNRQSSTRIVVTEQDVGESSASFFAGIPCLDYRRHVLVGPVDRERAAVQQHKHYWLTSRADRFEQSLLTSWESDVGSIAASKSFRGDHHLLALERGRESEHDDRDVGLASGFDGLL